MAERRDKPDKGVLKKQLKEHEGKLTDLDARLTRVETIQERQEGYRRLRVERCAGLDTLWNSVESKVPAAELRSRTANVLEQSVQEALKKEVEEDQLQAKAQELSGGKRATRVARASLADRVVLRDLVEWVKKDRSGAFNIILVAGEPSRLLYEVIRKEVNWCLTDVCRYIPTGVPFKEKAKARARARPKEKANKRARQPASKMRTREAGTTTLFLLCYLVQQTTRQGPQ